MTAPVPGIRLHLFYIVLACLLSQMTCSGAGALAAEPPIQSAAEIDYPPFSIVDAQGRADGFSVELLRAVLQAMGREVSFRTGPWSEVKSWLEQGEVQCLPLVGRTPEREAVFDFTFPYMTLHGAIVVRDDAQDIHDLDDLRGKRVAVMHQDNAEEFLRREERGIEIVTTPTFADALRLVSLGQADAVVLQRLLALRLLGKTGLANLKILSTPVRDFRQDFCFAVREGDRETLSLLNEGLALVMADGTYRHLHAKWFAALELPSGRRIIIGGDHNFPPYEYLDANGLPAGFNVDLTRAIAREMGLDVEIRLGPWDKIRQELASGAIDAVQGMYYSTERDLAFDFSPPHAVNTCISVVRRDGAPPPESLEELHGKRIVVQRGDIMHDYALKHGLKDITAVDAQEDALLEVADGKRDVALVSRMTALYWIDNLGLDTLVVGKTPLLSPEYCYAVPNNSRALLAQLSEGLKTIDQAGEYRRIWNRWMGVYEDEPRLVSLLKPVALFVLPLLLLLGAAMVWTWLLRRQVAKRTAALRESEAAFRQSNELLSLFIKQSPIYAFIKEVSPDQSRVITASDNFIDMIGIAGSDMTGKTMEELFPADFAAKITADDWKVVSKGENLKLDEELKGRSYTTFKFPISLGERKLLAGYTVDITDRQRAEVERERLTAQLMQAQKMEAIGRLAGGIAHDFNNMLSVITGYAEMLLQELPPHTSQWERINEIKKAGRQSADLVRQLMAFARRQIIAPQVLDLNQAVSNLLSMLRTLVGENINLKWIPASDAWPVRIDPSQVDQILTNLAVNARDAIQDVGQLTIETKNVVFDDKYCASHMDCSPGKYVLLAVSDSGSGMDEETLSRLFEPFFTTKEEGKGTGLGLSTVYGIVRQNKGFINVYSEPEQGTCFKVYLPRSRRHTEELDVSTDAAIKPVELDRPPEHAAPIAGQTILIVEDKPAVLELCKDMVESLGYSVMTASSPEEARGVARECRDEIHLLMTDVVMPGMNGRELCAHIRSRRPNIKCLLMSGYTANVIAQHGVLEDDIHFIEKPFVLKSLAEKLREVLSPEQDDSGELEA